MNPPQADPSPWLLPAILIGFPIVFALIWSFVCFLLSAVGGWGRLAQRFATEEPGTGQEYRSQSGRVGVVNYNRVLRIHMSPAGLRLDVFALFRIGHKPLLIPWSEIHHAVTSQWFFAETVVFEVGLPKLAKVRLPKKVFAGAPVTLDSGR